MADSIQTEQKPAGGNLSDAELLELFAGHGVYRDNAAQYRGRLDGQLLINRCADCDRYHQPPRPMCPSCWSFDVVPTPVSGRGTIYLLIHLHAGPPAEGVEYRNGGHPVVVVELEEQEHLRVTGTVHGFDLNGPSIGDAVELDSTTPTTNDPSEPESNAPSIGDAVELDFLDRGGVPIVAFRPSRSHQPNRPSKPSRRPNHATEPSHATEPGRASRRDHRSRD